MSVFAAFDTTLEKTNLWLRDVMTELDWDDRHRAYLALRGVLHALRDRLQPDEAVHLGAQLPMLIRGFYYEGWRPSATPKRERHREQFLDHVREAFPRRVDIDSERVTRAVFAVLARRISKGEMEDVQGMMPEEVRDLWTEGTPEGATDAPEHVQHSHEDAGHDGSEHGHPHEHAGHEHHHAH